MLTAICLFTLIKMQMILIHRSNHLTSRDCVTLFHRNIDMQISVASSVRVEHNNVIAIGSAQIASFVNYALLYGKNSIPFGYNKIESGVNLRAVSAPNFAKALG